MIMAYLFVFLLVLCLVPKAMAIMESDENDLNFFEPAPVKVKHVLLAFGMGIIPVLHIVVLVICLGFYLVVAGNTIMDVLHGHYSGPSWLEQPIIPTRKNND